MVKDKVLGVEVELRKLTPASRKPDPEPGERVSTIHARVKFEDPDVSYGAWTAYEVLVGGQRIGAVASHREENATVHNRIRYVRGVTRYWEATRSGRGPELKRRVGYHYFSRRDAVEGLVREVCL